MAPARDARGRFVSGGIKWESDTLSPRLAAFPQKVGSAVGAVMKYYEPRVQSAMRSNAPWTDRTSNARNGLFAKYVPGDKKHVIVAFHTMPYGIWLEVRWSGRYAVILPTIQDQGRQLMQTLNKMLARL